MQPTKLTIKASPQPEGGTVDATDQPVVAAIKKFAEEILAADPADQHASDYLAGFEGEQQVPKKDAAAA